jgi:hypothetical protein
VKHFCPIEAQNLTSLHTSVSLERCGIARKVGPLAIYARAWRNSTSALADDWDLIFLIH